MDSELMNEALVYGLDNPDPLQLELDEEDRHQSDNQLVLSSYILGGTRAMEQRSNKIEVSTEKAEIAKLREELLRVMELNRTITTSYKQLLVSNSERTPQKSDSKRKLCSLLQEELEEKTIFCQNITAKMNNYKRKYQALKAKIGKTSDTSSVDNRDSQLALIEKENTELKKEISNCKENELKMADKLKQTESKLQALSSVESFLGNGLIVQKIKARAGLFSQDAGKMVDSISKLRELIDDLVGSTPSTNWREDEGLVLDVPHGLDYTEDGTLGKRGCILDSTPNKDDHDERLDDSNEEMHTLIFEPKHITQDINVQHVESKEETTSSEERPETDAKKKFKIDKGSSDDEEESSLSYDAHTIHLIDKKLNRLNKADRFKPSYSNYMPNKKRIEGRSSPTKQPAAIGNRESVDYLSQIATPKQETSDMKLEEFVPAAETRMQIPRPTVPPLEMTIMCQKAVVPSFLTDFSKPSHTQLIDRKPESTCQTNGQSMLSSKIAEKPEEGARKPHSTFMTRAWQYLTTFKINPSNPTKQREDFFSILNTFREQSASRQQSSKLNDRKGIVSHLLQTAIKTESYLLRDVLKYRCSSQTVDDGYQLFVYQNIFFVIFISCFSEDELSSQEQRDAAYFLGFRNPNLMLAEKFDKLCEVAASAKTKSAQNTGTSAGDKHQHSTGRKYAHHFPLIKLVFNHLVHVMESVSLSCHTEDDFSAAVLAKKMNLGELKDSCHYVIEKLARTPLKFEFLADLPDFLSSLRLLFSFARSIDFNMSRIYFDGLRGVFSNRKYRNSSQQIVVCLILRQLNSLDEPN